MIALYMLKPLEDTIFWKIGTYTIAAMLWVILVAMILSVAYGVGYALFNTLRWAYRIARTERRR